MKINKETCVHFFNNDVFILENMGKYLLINDQYNNLKLLDFSLNTIDEIPIKVSLPGYDLLKSCNNDSIAFFDPDEEALLIVNILTKKTFFLCMRRVAGVFSRLYTWCKDNLIVATYNNIFYQIKPESQRIEECSVTYVKQSVPEFFSFWHKASKYSLKINVNSCQKTFIYETNDKVIYVDYQKKKEYATNKPKNLDYHNIMYFNTIFVFIAEDKIAIQKHDKIVYIFPENILSYFIKACLIEENNYLYLCALTTNKSNVNDNQIIKYKIEHETI